MRNGWKHEVRGFCLAGAVVLTGALSSGTALAADGLSEEIHDYQISVERIFGEFAGVEYPVIAGGEASQEVLDHINEEFRSRAEDALAEADEDLSETWQVMQENDAPVTRDQLVYEEACQNVFTDADIYSVEMGMYSYRGGAHGYACSMGYSYDLSTGEELTMGGLLGCDERIAEDAVILACRQEIIGQVENTTEESVRAAFSDMEFWMEEDGMHVSFAPYVLASYAAGPQNALVTPELVAQAAAAGPSQVTITVINGIRADADDFILPYSSVTYLTSEDLEILEGNTVEEEHYKSQLAINEILARYGYAFHPENGGSAKEAYDQFEGKVWYEQAKPYCPTTSASEMIDTYLSWTERSNIDLICEWQKEHDCYY